MNQEMVKKQLFHAILGELCAERAVDLLQEGVEALAKSKHISILDQTAIDSDPELQHRFYFLRELHTLQNHAKTASTTRAEPETVPVAAAQKFLSTLRSELEAIGFQWQILPVAAQSVGERSGTSRVLRNRAYTVSVLSLGGDLLLTLEFKPRYWTLLQRHPQARVRLEDRQQRVWLPDTPLQRFEDGSHTISCGAELQQIAQGTLPAFELVLAL